MSETKKPRNQFHALTYTLTLKFSRFYLLKPRKGKLWSVI